MKIAIMTQPLGKNYGGIMQAFALQTVLKDLGHEVNTIDRRVNKRNLIYRGTLRLKINIYKRLNKYTHKQLTSKQEQFILSGMSSFLDKYVARSRPIYSNRKLIKHFKNERYDAVVVGSDQVWRPSYAANIYNNFLDFTSSINFELNAIAYAASFGVDTWEYDSVQTEKCSKLIERFQAVSVRESNTVKMCQENLGVKPEVVLDPTLLIDPSIYINISGATQSSGGKGLLTYILDPDQDKRKSVENLAKNLGMPLFYCQPKLPISDGRGKSIYDYKYPSVEKWLESFINADYIITDSFHGCVFSIIFNKPFLAIANEKRGVSRFTSLLSTFGLNHRLIFDYNENLEEKIIEAIDWEDINNKLKEQKKLSLDFLNRWF